ncbi:hypothetical protein [Pyrobaculum ferrireducens]|uniref:Uncharacterized protein n=1 Tax=Pyrobaculum ferrireducens TaxID=1104324 RepID=G7VF12_9CREN|nr:hypothetical protein [Pyrobaculum ferrireducens]AET34177.1 hypothetical protein P186_2801 [Pyrobaculum ferrireducens]
MRLVAARGAVTGEQSRRISAVEELLGRYRRITAGGRHSVKKYNPVKKYVASGRAVVVVKFAQISNWRSVFHYVRERRERLNDYARCVTIVFDCDAPAESCARLRDGIEILNCADPRQCCAGASGVAHLSICDGVSLLSFAPRLEDLSNVTCSCAYCEHCGGRHIP